MYLWAAEFITRQAIYKTYIEKWRLIPKIEQLVIHVVQSCFVRKSGFLSISMCDILACPGPQSNLRSELGDHRKLGK